MGTASAGQPAREDIGTAPLTPAPAAAPAGSVRIWTPPAATYDSGTLVTHPGGGAAGADACRLQSTSLGLTTLGFSASTAGAFRIADDITVPAGGWIVNTITFFGYQTGSTTTSTFNDVRVQIWSGNPSAGGTIVFGDTTTNRFGSTAFSNITRDTETAVGDGQRPIMATTSNTIAQALAAGSYWVDFQLGGTLASGPFIPPLTTLGSTSGTCVGGTCNAQQWSGTAWAAVDDGMAGTQPQDVRLVIDFTLTPVELESFSVD